MGYVLFIIASILKWVLTFPAYLFGLLICILSRQFSQWHFDLAVSKDQYGNVLCKYLFNLLLIKKSGYKFGKPDETISSVLGKNAKTKTLTLIGRIIGWTLNKLDPNHLNKAIETDE